MQWAPNNRQYYTNLATNEKTGMILNGTEPAAITISNVDAPYKVTLGVVGINYKVYYSENWDNPLYQE